MNWLQIIRDWHLLFGKAHLPDHIDSVQKLRHRR